MSRGRRCGEGGAAIVEAAIVLPLLLFIILGVLDYAQWEFQQTQASAAARDGARTGIIHYRTADSSTCASGTDCDVIQQSVANRLAGQGFTMDTPVCVHPNDNVALSTGCGSAIAGCDRLFVKVHWARHPFSLAGSLFGVQTVTGEARMVIAGTPVGAPPASVDAQGCV